MYLFLKQGKSWVFDKLGKNRGEIYPLPSEHTQKARHRQKKHYQS